jgi:hypothetical protein
VCGSEGKNKTATVHRNININSQVCIERFIFFFLKLGWKGGARVSCSSLRIGVLIICIRLVPERIGVLIICIRLVPERIGVLIICNRLVPERIGVLIICDRWVPVELNCKLVLAE